MEARKSSYRISLRMSRSQQSSSLVSQTSMRVIELQRSAGIELSHIFWQVQAKMEKLLFGTWSSQSQFSSLWNQVKACQTWATLIKTKSKPPCLPPKKPRCFGTLRFHCSLWSPMMTTKIQSSMCGTCVTQTILLQLFLTSIVPVSYPYRGVFQTQPLLYLQARTSAQL